MGDFDEMKLTVATLAVFAAIQTVTSSPQPSVVLPPSVAQAVLVDTIVTDSKGRPVTDLKVDDFELFEDDRRVAISLFQAPATALPPSEKSSSSANAVPTKSTRAIDDRIVAIYADRKLLSPGGRKRALDQAADLARLFIDRGARVVVIAEDPGLRALTPLTSDVAVVRGAFERIQGWATQSPGVVETRETLDRLKSTIELAESGRMCEGSPCLCVLPELISAIRGYAVFRDFEATEAAARLSVVFAALHGLPGRKSLIYVSEGLEHRPGIQLFDQLFRICPDTERKDASSVLSPMQEFDTSRPLKDAAARANALGVTIYPLDARGLGGLSTGDITMTDRRYVPSARNDSIKDANLAGPQQLLAEETGGFAMLRGLGPESAMRRFETDDAARYLLAFVPGEADGRRHVLRARLKPEIAAKRKVEIRHRLSYFRTALPDRRGQRALSVLVFGLEENSIGLDAEVVRTGAESAEVRATIPEAAFRSGGGDGATRSWRIVIAFRALDAPSSQVTVREKEVDIAAAPGAGSSRSVAVEIPISTHAYDVVVGVEGPENRVSYLRRRLEAQK